MEPFDSINNCKFVFEGCTEISLTKLEHPNAYKEKLNKRYIDLILLRVINPTGSNVGNLSVSKRQKNRTNIFDSVFTSLSFKSSLS